MGLTQESDKSSPSGRPGKADSDAEKDIYNTAIGLLARREHSRRELFQKLSARFNQAVKIDLILDRLQEHGLQCDRRYAQSFVRARIMRGQGPLRINRELQQNGVEPRLCSEALNHSGQDWTQLALDVARRKFDLLSEIDFRQKARVTRFLQQRGFTFEHIDLVLRKARIEDSDRQY